MVNILDIDPECFMVSDTKECTDGTMVYNICYSDKTDAPHIVLIILIVIFKKVVHIVF